MATIDELSNKRRLLKTRLTKFSNFVNGFNNAHNTITELKLKLNKFMPTWEEFENIQSQIDLEDSSQKQIDERDYFEEQYDFIVAKTQDIISNHEKAQPTTSKSFINSLTPVPIQLPCMNLPTFDGKFENWLSFRDSFNSIMNRSGDVDSIQKLHYLQSSLKPGTFPIIDSLTSKDENFQVAWDYLEKRYGNNRLIQESLIDAILDIPVMAKNSAQSLRNIIDKLFVNLKALENVNVLNVQAEPFIIRIIKRKLDVVTSNEWESTLNSEFPTLKQFEAFLTKRCEKLESLDRDRINSSHQNEIKSVKTALTTQSRISISSNLVCPFCKSDHRLHLCEGFKALLVTKRIEFVKNQKLCLNCLRPNHTVNKCFSSTCRLCHKKHHSVLHIAQDVSSSPKSNTADQSGNGGISTIANCITYNSQTLLSTALITIYDKNNKAHLCRALLDVGSQVNIISKSLAVKLDLKSKAITTNVSGINKGNTPITSYVNVKIKSRTSGYAASIDCLILNAITENIPSYTFPLNTLEIPKGIHLADPEFNKSSEIDILLGSEIFWDLLCVGQIKGQKGQPHWQKTQLGWVVGGKFITKASNQQHHLSHVAISQTNFNLSRFWELEEFTSNPKDLNSDEVACENHFLSNYARTPEGRFCVRLPFTSDASVLGVSHNQALAQFLTLERKLQHKPDQYEQYREFMNEYISMGHMTKALPSEISQYNSFYLPHHAVIKESSSSTKLRVVFNGSAKTTSGLSLNDILMAGPALQNNLISITLRFRSHPFVLKADISKMYRQIAVHENDQKFQLILWRNSSTETIKTYKLSTVTYGTKPAPFLAIRCLNQLAQEHKDTYPRAHKIITQDFYVDDMLTGADSIEELRHIQLEVTQVLALGCFGLHKWSSNVQNFFTAADSVENKNITLNLDSDSEPKTLGLIWDTKHDCFKYTISNFKTNNKITKRTILSNISQIFDPLGLIGPVIIQAKILIQKLWVLAVGWDESIPLSCKTMWENLMSELHLVTTLTIPRYILVNSEIDKSKLQLHAFCDASEAAYGACVYIVSNTFNGEIDSRLLCAKSKVAPLKKITVPCLELCAALLLSRLVKNVTSSLGTTFESVFCWTDSKIVVAWLNSESRRWNTFVANRVSEIQNITSAFVWRHVKSKENPADLISRGVSPSTLIKSELWWNGPQWLRSHQTMWPSEDITIELAHVPEQKRCNITATVSADTEFILNKYSSFIRLQRVIAYILRFASNTQHKSNFSGPLSCTELSAAKRKIILLVQKEKFAEEIVSLQKGNALNKASYLLSLDPFIDTRGLLRVGGRLQRAHINYDEKHQLILPKDHYVTKLIIKYEHEKQLHAGTQATLNSVRESYWPIAGKQCVRKVIRKCITCFKVKPITLKQIMSELPEYRVNPCRVFANCCVDYAGPINIKASFLRSNKTIKSYIALFICSATKAVHLELVTDLTSECFLAALKRFMSRRGKVNTMLSDNATTFVGADNELKRLATLLKSKAFEENVIDQLAIENITWKFIPARSPHFGGLWEAGIKSTKTHLKKVIGTTTLTYEKLYTVLAQIEACLNSRPLTPISNDPNDFQVLTPGHFLIGSPLTTTLDENYQKSPANRLSQWQHLQQMTQHFWKRWSKEYLHQLQQRSKWKTRHAELLQPGTMVLVQDDLLPPLCWPLGRILETFPGADGLVRSASVKTANNTVKRAINKLCILPLEEEPPIS